MVELDTVRRLEVDWRNLEDCKWVVLGSDRTRVPDSELVQVEEVGRTPALLGELGLKPVAEGARLNRIAAVERPS